MGSLSGSMRLFTRAAVWGIASAHGMATSMLYGFVASIVLFRRHGEMHAQIALDNLEVLHVNRDRGGLAAKTGVDGRVAADQSDDTERAPKARRPPPVSAISDPGRRGAEREGVQHPGLTTMRIEGSLCSSDGL